MQLAYPPSSTSNKMTSTEACRVSEKSQSGTKSATLALYSLSNFIHTYPIQSNPHHATSLNLTENSTCRTYMSFRKKKHTHTHTYCKDLHACVELQILTGCCLTRSETQTRPKYTLHPITPRKKLHRVEQNLTSKHEDPVRLKSPWGETHRGRHSVGNSYP